MSKFYNNLLNRRRFMTALGISAVGLPVAGAFLKNRLRAQSAGSPVRFLAVKTFHGNHRDIWIPRSTSGAEPGNADMALSDLTFDYDLCTLKPLQAWRDHVTVLDGIDHAILAEIEPGFAGHERASAALTGYGVSDGQANGGGPSVDQILKTQLGSAAGKSLVLGADSSGLTGFSFNNSGVPIEPEDNPVKAFNDAFAGFVGQGDPQAERDRALRTSILDHNVAEINRLRSELTGAEREKLDAHLAGLENLEQQLNRIISCDSPSAPGAPSGSDWQYVDNAVSGQAHVIAQAFACDVSRVATLHILGDYPTPQLNLPEMPPGAMNTYGQFHNGVTHLIWDSQPKVGSAVHEVYSIGQQWMTKNFVAILEALNQPDPLGEGTILDNTIIYWTNELGANGGHADDYDNIPVVIGGGGGGAIKQGRYLKLRSPNSSNYVPHNKVFTSICHAMGLDTINYVGDPRAAGISKYQGPLSELMT
ncbi:MAG: DUF1552 domain-containing protein [Myxococcales bacterium]|nr:MAG: DUF1552 domain-containing protein [Myxococcales bacterium]